MSLFDFKIIYPSIILIFYHFIDITLIYIFLFLIYNYIIKLLLLHADKI